MIAMAGSQDIGVRAGDGIVLRTPLLPLTALVEWGAAPDHRAYLAAVLELPEVREALFVASPSLTAALAGWKADPTSASGARVERSIVKYVARMMGRSTPFGLFSAVSAGVLGRETALELAPRTEYRRRTRLDNDYLFVLAGELANQPEAKRRLSYRPNDSIYRSAGRIRYACARVVDKDRSYHLVSVEPTPYLESTLERARAGATREALAEPLVGNDVAIEDARAYVDELIDAQLIVPALGVCVTGPEPIDGMIVQLRTAGLDEVAAILDDVRGKLAAIDAGGLGNLPDRYHAVASALEALPAKLDVARLFQVDMVKPANATLSSRVAAEVARAVGLLAKLRHGRESLDDFKHAFRERWDDRVVPLCDVLDEESGIGFEAARGPGAEGAPLLVGLPFARATPDERTRWGGFEQRMLTRLAGALASGAQEIVLDDADLATMKRTEPGVLPDAFALIIRVAGPDPGTREPTILIDGVSGPSGARLLGRFCHASPEIDAIVRAHHALEEALRPDATFAEIVHLNEGRIGNVLCRPVLRGHEIVYLGVSGAPNDAQISIDDLDVAIRGDRIVVLSRRLGCEVIPRLTTAHNFRLRSLGVYRFLCALANQDCDTVGFSWGPLGGAPFLPRVRIGRAVVARAAWTLDRHELEPITAAVRAATKAAERNVPAQGPSVAERVAALRSARGLPRLFAISEGDNELPIDLDNPLLVAAFADEISGSETARLVELFPAPDRLLVHGPEGSFANELIVTFTKREAAASRPATPRRPDRSSAANIRRDFPPGSEWLFAKIYCGESTTDRVLGALAPWIRDVVARGDVHRWFFIRYRDPDPHLRLRFAGDPARLLGGVLPELDRAIAPFAAAGAVRKLVLDTYVREVERYGGERAIELVEELFWRDSEAVLGIVALLDGDAGAIARWKLAVRGIDSMLDAIGLSPEVRANTAIGGKIMLGRELRADTALWTKVGERFARERAELELMFDRDPVRDADHELEPGFALLAERDALLRPIGERLRAHDAAGELAPRLDDIAWSLVHMHANRLLHASQRAQEMVLYDFVRRLHAARKARGSTGISS